MIDFLHMHHRREGAPGDIAALFPGLSNGEIQILPTLLSGKTLA
jgi:hypothetical protein